MRFLFGLAPSGVYPAVAVTATAVRSYRTFSPLPSVSSDTANDRSGGIFSVALSVGSHRPGVTWHPALGARTFLPANRQQILPTLLPSGCPTNSFRYLKNCTSTNHQWDFRSPDSLQVGDSTHPGSPASCDPPTKHTPVSYTHLTLPTILLV